MRLLFGITVFYITRSALQENKNNSFYYFMPLSAHDPLLKAHIKD